MLTDNDVQINAYFAYWPETGDDNSTYTKQIGILVRDHRIQIDTDGLTIDRCEMLKTRRFCRVDGGAVTSIERLDRLNERFPEGAMTPMGYPRCSLIRGYRVTTFFAYEIVVVVSQDETNPPYLNLAISLKRRLWPHGIIGQTADHDGVARKSKGRNGEGVIEGTYTDYEVSSLWANDFKFNRYYGVGQRRQNVLRRLQRRFSIRDLLHKRARSGPTSSPMLASSKRGGAGSMISRRPSLWIVASSPGSSNSRGNRTGWSRPWPPSALRTETRWIS